MTSSKTAKPQPIDRAKEELKRTPILALDLSLAAIGASRGHRSELDTQAHLAVLAEAVLRAAAVPFSSSDDLIAAVLSERACEDLACSALLRLLVQDDDVFREDGRLRHASQFFDRHLSARLYPKLGIATKDQAFEKREALRAAVANIEIEMQSQLNSLTSVDAVPAWRSQANRLLHDPLTEIILTPLLPSSVNAKGISDAIAAAADVVHADDQALLERAAIATDHCAALRTAVADSPYLTSFLGSLATTLISLVRDRVKARGLADPADLRLRNREKRYPLTREGNPILLRLDVENVGTGKARDVSISIGGC